MAWLRACVPGALCVLLLAACGEKKTELGQGGSVVTGSAGPEGARNAARELQRCDAPVATVALAAGHYTALLVAELGGHPVVLDQKTFEVLATGTPPPGPPPGPPPSPRAIPALNGWGMAALAMCLALCGAAGAARRRRRSTAP